MADDLVTGCRILDGCGLTTAFGHLSRRDGERVLVSSSAGPGLVRAARDLVDARGDDPRVPGETAIHLGIYDARPDVAAVARFHGPACLAWSALVRPLPAVIGMGLFCGDLVPVHDTATTIRTPEQGAALAATLADGVAVLLRGFGAVTVGRSVREAVARAWFLERSAAAVLAASAAGDPHPYPPGAAAPFLAADGPAAAQIDRLWHYLRETT